MEYLAHGVRGIGWGAKQRHPVGSGTQLEPGSFHLLASNG